MKSLLRKPWKRCTSKKIPLKPSRSFMKFSRRESFDWVFWEKAPPFAVNKRGVLTHRVRHVDTILSGGREKHAHVEYLCGNGCNFNIFDSDEFLVADPPESRLLCVRCEEVAVRNKLPSGDEIAGRHVHRGILVPQQVCCAGRSWC